MRRRYITKLPLILIGLLVIMGSTGVGSCHDITVEPKSQEIPIGGNGTYNICVDIIGSIDAGDHDMTIMFYNSTGSPTDKLNGSLTSDEVSIEDLTSTSSQIECSWDAEEAGTYNFSLEVEFNESATEEPVQGEEFAIQVIDNDADTSFEASTMVASTAVPELTTAVLVTAGLLGIAVWRRSQ
ncbi:MAG: hypothetical protein ACOC5C_05265 [Halobacteriota archaeon]